MSESNPQDKTAPGQVPPAATGEAQQQTPPQSTVTPEAGTAETATSAASPATPEGTPARTESESGSSNVGVTPPPPASPTTRPSPPASDGHKLSTFMKVSIGILTAVTLASIALLFIGDFEGKFERVFSTMALFAVFVLLTGFDTRRERKNEWYAPVALIANAYILGLLLIVIWVTPYDPFGLQWAILWKSVFVIGTTRLVTFGMELLLRIGEERPVALGRWGQITSLLGVLSLIMFTAPVGIEAFRVDVPDLYWKFAVATLILTALGLAITLLLRWYYRAAEKPAKARVPAQQNAPHHGAPIAGSPTAHGPDGGTMPAPMPPQQPAPPQAAPEQTQDAPQLLPWPTFADGTPLPAGPDGQPDFSVLHQPPQAPAPGQEQHGQPGQQYPPQ